MNIKFKNVFVISTTVFFLTLFMSSCNKDKVESSSPMEETKSELPSEIKERMKSFTTVNKKQLLTENKNSEISSRLTFFNAYYEDETQSFMFFV